MWPKLVKSGRETPGRCKAPCLCICPRGTGIPMGSKGTFRFIFFELQSQNLQESRTWLILCREALRPRKEEERKAGNKQSRRTSWLTPPSQILHPVALRTTGQCPWGCSQLPQGWFLPSHPTPSSGRGFLCVGEGTKLEWKTWVWPGGSREFIASSSSFSSHVHPGGCCRSHLCPHSCRDVPHLDVPSPASAGQAGSWKGQLPIP